MKKTLTNSLLAISILLLIFSCKSIAQNTNISSVDYTFTVGRGGRSSITITQDSISRNSMGGRFTDVENFSKKLEPKDWKALFNGVNTELLETTNSGKSKGVYDGRDDIFTIVSKEKKHTIINTPESDSGYKNLETLKNNITTLVSKYQ